MGVDEQSAQILIKGDEQATTLNWDAMKWARPYLNEERQGEAPKSATDIMQPGHVIYVRSVGDEHQLRLAQVPEPSSACFLKAARWCRRGSSWRL